MVSILDVAAYILKKQGPMTAMKLQKLVYYSQAWSLVWDERPLFTNRIEAWANGPVAPFLYNAHRGMFLVRSGDIRGDCRHLDRAGRETINAVLRFYGKKSSQWLSMLTHREAPWKDARKGLDAGERGTQEISHASLQEYYEALN